LVTTTGMPRSRKATSASSAPTEDRASPLERRVMLLTPSSSVTTPKSGSTSVMSSFSPCHAGAVMLTSLGMRTTPAAVRSKMREPAARKTEEASSGSTRMRCTCS
jgi:hypothetical protein